MELIVATGNRGKLKEIRAVLDGLNVSVQSVADYLPGFDPEETGETFLDNAVLKALTAFERVGKGVVADDSGLCVVGLGLEPGVRSARYAGEDADDDGRMDFLLKKMENMKGEERVAWFACRLVAILPLKGADLIEGVEFVEGPNLPAPFVAVTTEGRLMGRIGYEKRGEHGFGYDPVFLPDPFPGVSLAEVPLADKNKVSHRGVAFRRFREFLESTRLP